MKCECFRFKSVNEVKRDLCKHGFIKHYYYWTHHGEEVSVVASSIWKRRYTEAWLHWDDVPELIRRMWLEEFSVSLITILNYRKFYFYILNIFIDFSYNFFVEGI